MDYKVQELLAPRITKHCLQLLQDGHFKHAAREAMVQVEMALKEKGRIEDIQFGATLIGNLFAGKQYQGCWGGVRLEFVDISILLV